MAIQTLMIHQLTLDHQLQSRAAMNESTIKDYRELIETSIELPPITVFHDEEKYYVADGWHRLEAYKRAGRDRINAEIKDGSHKEAFLHSLSANATHGLQRSQADKRRAVQMAINHPETGTKSDRELAKACRVSHTFVGSVRSAISVKAVTNPPREISSNWPEPEKKVATLPPDTPDADMPYESYTELDEALDTNKALTEEIEQLQDRLAIKALDATEDEKGLAAGTIESLRRELKLITIERNSLKDSRNSYQNENAELKRQCSNYLAVMKKLNQQITSLQDELSLYRAMGGTGSQSSQPQTHPTGTPAF